MSVAVLRVPDQRCPHTEEESDFSEYSGLQSQYVEEDEAILTRAPRAGYADVQVATKVGASGEAEFPTPPHSPFFETFHDVRKERPSLF